MAQDDGNAKGQRRVLLEGVPYVGFDHFSKRRWVETCPFPACVRAWLEFMGDDITQESGGWAAPPFGYGPAFGYTHAMSTSGVGFQLLWHESEWDNGNLHVMRMDPDRKRRFRRTLQCAGYSHEICYVGERDRDEAFFRNAVIESVRDRNRPVIAFGVVGPPDRPCLVTGFDEGGDVLIGWSFYQGPAPDEPDFEGCETEPSGYFRKRDWFPDLGGAIIIRDKLPEPSQRELRRQALRWALDIMRTPSVRDPNGVRFHSGPAAYVAWAETLQQDDEFPADDMDVLRQRHHIYHEAVEAVAEGRTYAGAFALRVAEAEPAMTEELLEFAECCGAEHDLMWKVWAAARTEGHGEAEVQQLADGDVRRSMIPFILAARDLDIKAAGHLERALRAAGVRVD